MPESSLAYSEFTFLNELNNLKVNGVSSVEAKQLIYEYAKSHRKVSLSACLKLLQQNGLVEKDAKKEEVFSGIDGDFHTSVSSYVAFHEILGERVDTNRELCEEIIEWVTTITSDKNRLATTLKNRFNGFLSENEIKRIKSLNFGQWGRFSQKLLTGTFSAGCCDENGEVLSILEVMRRENKNFMEVFYKYHFDKAVEEYNQETVPSSGVTYQMVQQLYCSPAVKRAIWRTVELVREIVKVMGGAPKKIFVEMARDGNDEAKKGQRTLSRKQQLLDLYRNIKGEELELLKQIEQTSDTKFNSKKLFLYYLQMGKSMYSGKTIPLECVFQTNVCDIEHIYPRSKIKDDSLDNVCLVYKTENAAKGDSYPLSNEIRKNILNFSFLIIFFGLFFPFGKDEKTETSALSRRKRKILHFCLFIVI